MSDGFDRAPGAGRGRSRGLGRGGGGPEGGGFPNGAGAAERPRHQPPPQPKAPGFLQPPPLRQPRTAPPPGAQCEVPAGPQRPPRPGALPEQTRPLRAPPSSQDNIPQQNLESAMAKPQVVVAPVLMSKLSVNAPEFYPSGYSSNYTVSMPFYYNSGLILLGAGFVHGEVGMGMNSMSLFHMDPGLCFLTFCGFFSPVPFVAESVWSAASWLQKTLFTDYQEKYQELLEREDFFPDYEENGTDLSGAGDPYLDDIDDEMDPEIEEAYEKFCLESERKRKQ
uniref:polyadenylate-binding protein-interacting protein 1 n=1 Tax=Panthera onca TaxID=9690 RepID=UPI002955A533|nr:polyadenylate-binding protein-interacting protein 1 [Panthera onca]